MAVSVRAYAKINWSLRVTGRRADGYHDIETIFQTISLHDTLTFTPSTSLSLACDDASIPTGDSNLVLRAARALGAPPVAISLQKRIPAGGGLGGGSSDAAATLVALSRMFDIKAPLHEIALSLGSDVPFFLVGGTAYATGRGEVLTPLLSRAGVALLLLLPEERVMTAEAFGMLTRMSTPAGPEAEFVNDFEEPVFTKLPHLAALKRRLHDGGATWAAMTGSGSTIVGAFRDTASRNAARAAFNDVRHEVAETV